MMKKTLLSGIQPSGKIHVGNYFGAIRQFIELEEKYECFVFVANYHALTTIQDADTLKQNSLSLAIDYIAAGVDPKKVVLFLQSDVPEVTELAWIFDTITTVPYLSRAHAFKDADMKGKEVNVGLFNYPMLMAADILMQDADVVPVGQDQKQHVEYARDTAEKFNRIYGPTFKLPDAHILENVAVIPGLDGRKMSKSYGNTIPFFATREELRKLVLSIQTDSKGITEPKNPDTCTIFALHRLFSGEQLKDIEARYRKGGIGYHESKEILLKNMEAFIAPFRAKREKIAKDPGVVEAILRNGGQKARLRAQAKMKDVRKKVGLS